MAGPSVHRTRREGISWLVSLEKTVPSKKKCPYNDNSAGELVKLGNCSSVWYSPSDILMPGIVMYIYNNITQAMNS